MGEGIRGGGFWPSLSRTFTWAVFQSNVFLLKLNAMQITVLFYTALKMAEHQAFLDSGATECFISQRFVNQYKLGTHLMKNPQCLQNADGLLNIGGGLTHYTELEVLTRGMAHSLRFYIANMGDNDLVLGYLWFVVTNAQPNWTEGTLSTPMLIHTKGVASGRPMHSIQVAGMRTTIQNHPLLQNGDELYLRIVQIDPT
jgi:hypothetical protein